MDDRIMSEMQAEFEDEQAEAMREIWLLEMAEDTQEWEFKFGVYPVEITA
jgi:hypothetical protein